MQVKYTTAIFLMTIHKNPGDQQPTNSLAWSENKHIHKIEQKLCSTSGINKYYYYYFDACEDIL